MAFNCFTYFFFPTVLSRNTKLCEWLAWHFIQAASEYSDIIINKKV